MALYQHLTAQHEFRAAILSAAMFLAWLLGGYVAGRMARRAGLSHGFYTWALGAVLLAVAGRGQ